MLIDIDVLLPPGALAHIAERTTVLVLGNDPGADCAAACLRAGASGVISR